MPLCGGDDLVVIVPGRGALALALDYLEEFQKKAQEELERPNAKELAGTLKTQQFSACAGVAIAKAHTPLSRLLELSHQLCQRAKNRSYHDYLVSGAERSCLDFQFITTPSWARLETVRSGRDYRPGKQLRVTACPYTVPDARKLLQAVRNLKRSNFPLGKLRHLYRSLYQGEARAKLEYLTMYLRAREDGEYSQRQALADVEKHLAGSAREPPWQDAFDGKGKGTRYGDLVEIYDFVNT